VINFVRSASIAPGKNQDALVFAKKISEHFAKTYDVTLTLSMPIGGNPNCIAWTASYPKLSDLEDVMSMMMMDQKYGELVKEHADCFIPGSVRDEIWRTLT
jgi:hypothetical protein